MTLTAGRRGTITDRDWEVLLALFFCRYASTGQLAHLFFPSASKARSRLAKLDEKGYVTSRPLFVVQPTKWKHGTAPQGVWNLTKSGFEFVTETLALDESFAAKPLAPKQARHYVRAAEIYAAVKHRLDGELGEYPGWEWRHEKRVVYAGEYENVPYQHKPDAHVLFCGHVFIVERQTAESKVGPKKIYEKVEDHKRYVETRLRKPAEVLFAFDTDDSPMIDTARRAGEQLGMEVVARDVAGIADYLYSAALRLSP
ncbi:MAG: replication-relaxation family protein [Actinomycetota bacterium]|nr:replication-relaxation family protein [Actinomycetota bacterium]